MMARLLVLLTVSWIAQAAKVGDFYVVALSFSDFGPQLIERVLEVKADGPDSVVRYSRVGRWEWYCGRLKVQGVEARLRGRLPADLVGRADPCGVDPKKLQAAVKKYPGHEGVFEAVSFGIVAECGGKTVVLALPISQKVDMKRLEQTEPELAQLWDLTWNVTKAAFGEKEQFHELSEAEDWATQEEGERRVEELKSGRYDEGLKAAWRGNVGQRENPTFRAVLAEYQGPVPAAQAKAGPVPRVVGVEGLRFAKYVAPVYPRLGLLARIEGTVRLRLGVKAETGEVEKAEVLSGHSLLTKSAAETAAGWRFDAGAPVVLEVGVAYELKCPGER